MLGVAAFIIGLLYVHTKLLDPIKVTGQDLSAAVHWVVDVPNRISHWADQRFASKEALLEKNEALQAELLIHKRKVQRMAALSAENTRLRQLLNSADSLEDRVLIAELIGVSPDPMKHSVILNRGSDEGVYPGQPVVDAQGLVGQVVNVTSSSSTVLLISDASQAIPVQLVRNGTRFIVEGRGSLFELYLRHVAVTMDIKEGDELVTSGLGQRFPVGYPVARIERIQYDPGRPFATVIARPMAELNKNRHVLLVFDKRHTAAQASSEP